MQLVEAPSAHEVARIWRYPVKSMLGTTANSVQVSATGAGGDRRYAIREASGRMGSGKNTSRHRKIDGLFRFRARYDGERAWITLPDGRDLDADAADAGDVLSAVLGEPVTLEREDDGTHFDDSPLHLLTTASLAWLKRTLPDARADERRFRPNLVLEVAGREPVEQTWIGRRLWIGAEVELEVTTPTKRCGMISFEQDDLPHDPSVLRHITNNADLLFGVYARVIRPGTVRVGDEVAIEATP